VHGKQECHLASAAREISYCPLIVAVQMVGGFLTEWTTGDERRGGDSNGQRGGGVFDALHQESTAQGKEGRDLHEYHTP
jgi:hypothetical protein